MNTQPFAFGLVAALLLTASLPATAVGQVPAPPPPPVPVPGWEVAGPYPADRVNREAYPNFYAIFLAPWQAVEAGADGSVELGAHFSRENPGGDLVIARRVFRADEDGITDLHLGYQGEADVFFNRKRVFSGRRPDCGAAPEGGGAPAAGAAGAVPAGETAPRAADPCMDRIPLYAQRGLNEIFLMVSSGPAAWGFRAATTRALSDKLTAHGGLEELWATPDTFLTSESVLLDPARNRLYVTSFDNQYTTRTEPSGYISILSMDGRVLEHQWVTGLNAPTGMDIWRDTLYVCEREDLLAIELVSGQVVGRWAIPDPIFPNDLAVDDEGAVYISDTRTGNWPDSRIYRFKDGTFQVWLNEGIDGANGLWIHDGALLVGNSGDGKLLRVNLQTRRVEEIVSLGSGIIDGIRVDEAGNYLVSFWEGQIFRISPEGEVVEILNALPAQWNTADFEYLPGEGVLLIPTFLENRVRAVRIGG